MAEQSSTTSSDDTRLFWAVEPRDGNDNLKDIHFKVLNPGCPAEQMSLKNEIKKTLSALKIIYGRDDKPRYEECFAKLLGLAQVGLVGPKPAINVAISALSSLQAEIVDRESGRVKNAYMFKLGRWALAFFAVSLVFFFALDLNLGWVSDRIFRYRNFLLVWSGAVAGAWASFASRKVTLTFFDLVSIEDDHIEPPLRLAFTIVLTTFLGLIFVTGLANVVFGSFKASSLLQSGSVAFLLGGLAGLGEKALPATLMQHTKSFYSNLNSNK
jgi:hypothetical protein